MNEAIKLAIEKGGYKIGGMQYALHLEVFIADLQAGARAVITQDPLFWQALGRALGWNDESKDLSEIYRDGVGYIMNDGGVDVETWLFYALNFFGVKLTGGDEEKFWKDLLT